MTEGSLAGATQAVVLRMTAAVVTTGSGQAEMTQGEHISLKHTHVTLFNQSTPLSLDYAASHIITIICYISRFAPKSCSRESSPGRVGNHWFNASVKYNKATTIS